MLARSLRFPLSFALAVAASGCAEGYFTPINAPPHPPVAREPREVEVYSGPPERAHVDVGILGASAFTWDAWLTAVRGAAAQQGCDAVVLNGHAQALCIMYVAPTEWSRTPPPPPPPPPAVRPLVPGMSASPMLAPPSISPVPPPPGAVPSPGAAPGVPL